MRLREAHVPVVLWVCAAAMLHLGGGEQADRLASMHDSAVRLRLAARGVASPETPLDVDLDFAPIGQAPAAMPETKPVESDQPSPSPDPIKDEEDKKKKEAEKKKEPPKKDPAKVDPPKQPPPPEPKQPEPPVAKKDPPPPPDPKAPPPPPPPPDSEKKISVQQHQDKDEKENPDAKYLAEKNHKVKPGEETHATITSLHENHKDPTPGTHQGPASEKPGNGDKDVVGHDEDRKGEKVAPNVIPKGAAPVAKVDPNTKNPTSKPGTDKGNDKAPTPAPAAKPVEAAKAPQKANDGKGPTAPSPTPDVVAGPNGAFTAPPSTSSSVVATAPSTAPPGEGNGKPKTLPTLPTPGGPKWVTGIGYGAKGEPGKPSISIDDKITKAAVGLDELDRLKKVEGETKLSIHRGAWKSSSLERWRAAIENYTPGVKPGNQTNLGTAAAPWATYLSQIHVRLHPIFADGFVESLNDLPATNPLNDKNLVTRMEIVMRPDGTLHHLGIIKPSGVTAFDIAALDAVDRAAPFGKAPTQIVSPDGLVYLHWEFHRDDMRCSNVNAYPYILKEGATPKAPEPNEPPKPKPPPEGEKKMGLVPPPPAIEKKVGLAKSPNG